MRLRLLTYLMIVVASTVGWCHFYRAHSYVSLEGFPDVRVVTTGRVADRWIGGVTGPLAYSVDRNEYELYFSIDDDRSLPTVLVEVRSSRPGIGLLPDDRWDETCLEASGLPLGRGGPYGRLRFDVWCNARDQRPTMKFHVYDATGRLADESIPYRLVGAAMRTQLDTI